jgi:hypothetical protein
MKAGDQPKTDADIRPIKKDLDDIINALNNNGDPSEYSYYGDVAE